MPDDPRTPPVPSPRPTVTWLLALAAVTMVGASCPGQHARDPRRAATRVDLAKDFLRKHDLEAAEQEAQKAIGFDDHTAEAHRILGLADFLRAQDNYRLRELDDCLTGVDADALRQEFDKNLRDADAHLARALELDRTNGEALANRGLVAIHREAYAQAIAYLDQALQHPSRLENIALVRSDLGWAHFHAGDYVSAANHLRQALQFQPGMCVATYRLGRVYFARKEWQKALESFQAVTADQSCPLQEAHLYLVMTYRELGMPVSAKTVQQCVKLAPKSCAAARCRTHLP